MKLCVTSGFVTGDVPSTRDSLHQWAQCRRWYTRVVRKVLSTCPSSVKKLKAVHCTPGLHAATQLRGTVHCPMCALCKRAVHSDYSAWHEQRRNGKPTALFYLDRAKYGNCCYLSLENVASCTTVPLQPIMFDNGTTAHLMAKKVRHYCRLKRARGINKELLKKTRQPYCGMKAWSTRRYRCSPF